MLTWPESEAATRAFGILEESHLCFGVLLKQIEILRDHVRKCW